jgi:hypothetical protein
MMMTSYISIKEEYSSQKTVDSRKEQGLFCVFVLSS